MVVGKTMIVAGIGSRKGVAVNDVLAAIDAALAAHGLSRGEIDRLATAELKRDEPALSEAVAAIGLELTIVDNEALQAASPRTLTHSDLSLALSGAPSVSEAAALAAAGPASRLLGPRLVLGSVTCALAVSEETAVPDPDATTPDKAS
jgi:cobalt-precorrin 5A hydrolase